MTFRPPGITAKAAATLDVLTGGRAFVGLGAGWWEREHAAFGVPFPPTASGSTGLEAAIETMRALWAPAPRRTTARGSACPRRPATPGRPGHPDHRRRRRERRTLRIAARLADAVNVRSDPVERKVARPAGALRDVGRTPTEVAVTVLDLPVVGRDRDDTWARVERLRGRTPAAAYAARTHAGTPAEQRDRYAALAAPGCRHGVPRGGRPGRPRRRGGAGRPDA